MITFRIEKKFKKVESIWRLLNENGNSTIYQSPEYAKLVCNSFFPYRFILRKTFLFVVFFEDGKPIMILPLFKSWFKRKYVLFGYKAGCGYLDAIYNNEMTVEKMQQCLSVLYQNTSIKNIKAYYVKENCILGQYLKEKQVNFQESLCTVISLPRTYCEFNETLSKNSRQNIRTAYNRLEKNDKKIEFTVFEANKLSKKLKSELLNLYADRQVKHYKKTGGLLYRLFIRFIDIGTKLQTKYEGITKVFVLRIDGMVAAYFDAIYGLDSIVVPRLAINEEYNWFSPGIVLLNEAIKFLCQEGNINKIDLTHGAERYKIAMGGTVNTCLQARIEELN